MFLTPFLYTLLHTLPHTLFLAPPPSAKIQRGIVPKGAGPYFGEAVVSETLWGRCGKVCIQPSSQLVSPRSWGWGYMLTYDHLPKLYQDRVGSIKLRQWGGQTPTDRSYGELPSDLKIWSSTNQEGYLWLIQGSLTKYRGGVHHLLSNPSP